MTLNDYSEILREFFCEPPSTSAGSTGRGNTLLNCRNAATESEP